jgi:hypothetical protein
MLYLTGVVAELYIMYSTPRPYSYSLTMIIVARTYIDYSIPNLYSKA